MHGLLGTIIRCFLAQLKYYTTEYLSVLIHTTGLTRALQTLVQMDLFINILKYAFQTRYKVIPVRFIEDIGLTSNLLALPNKCITSK